MSAVRYRFRTELRARWKAVVARAVLAGVAGGVALTAIAGARRTDTAFARMLRATRAADVLVNRQFAVHDRVSVCDTLDTRLRPAAVLRSE